MALAKGTNSYVTTKEAYQYFEDRIDAKAWEEATETRKEQALVTATSILDDLQWEGVAVSESQALAFPREGEFFDPRLGTQVSMTTIPLRIIRATFELAFHLINNEGLLDETGAVTELQVGSINLREIRKPSQLPTHVYNLIKPMLSLSSGSRMWWRAN